MLPQTICNAVLATSTIKIVITFNRINHQTNLVQQEMSNEVDKSVAALKSVLQTIGIAARSDNTILNCSIYSALTRVVQCIDALPSSIDKVSIMPIRRLSLIKMNF